QQRDELGRDGVELVELTQHLAQDAVQERARVDRDVVEVNLGGDDPLQDVERVVPIRRGQRGGGAVDRVAPIQPEVQVKGGQLRAGADAQVSVHVGLDPQVDVHVLQDAAELVQGQFPVVLGVVRGLVEAQEVDEEADRHEVFLVVQVARDVQEREL